MAEYGERKYITENGVLTLGSQVPSANLIICVIQKLTKRVVEFLHSTRSNFELKRKTERIICAYIAMREKVWSARVASYISRELVVRF